MSETGHSRRHAVPEPTEERELPLFPLQQGVLFPGMLLPLHIFEERYKVMIGTCHLTEQPFGVMLIREGSEVGAPAEPVDVGCTARIVELQRLPGGGMNLVAVGTNRFRLAEPARVMPEGFIQARVQVITSEPRPPDVPASLVADVLERFQAYLEALGNGSAEPGLTDLSALADEPVQLSFQVGASLRVKAAERQALLELDDLQARLERERTLLRRELQTLRLERGADKRIGPFSVN